MPSARTTAVARRALVWRAALIFAPANAETYRTTSSRASHRQSPRASHRAPSHSSPSRLRARLVALVALASRLAGFQSPIARPLGPSRIARRTFAETFICVRGSDRTISFHSSVLRARLARVRLRRRVPSRRSPSTRDRRASIAARRVFPAVRARASRSRARDGDAIARANIFVARASRAGRTVSAIARVVRECRARRGDGRPYPSLASSWVIHGSSLGGGRSPFAYCAPRNAMCVGFS